MHAIKERVRVGTGGRIVLSRPEISAGTEAEVIIMVEEQLVSRRSTERPLADFLGAGTGCFADAKEIDAFLRAERDSWES